MKEDAVLLNFARQGIVDDAAVAEALRAGKLRGFVTDFPSLALTGVPGVLALPHLGASTGESEENCAVMAAEALTDFLENGNIRHSVNFPDLILEPGPGARLAVTNRNIPKMLGQVLSDVGRCLKPGGYFISYEWCLTDKYDASNAAHRLAKKKIEEGDGLPDMCHTSQVDKAIRKARTKAGFFETKRPELNLLLQQFGGLTEQINTDQALGQTLNNLVTGIAERVQLSELIEQTIGLDRRHLIRLTVHIETAEGLCQIGGQGL